MENHETYDHVLMRGVHRVDNGNLKLTNNKNQYLK